MMDVPLLKVTHVLLKPLVYVAVKCKVPPMVLTLIGFLIGVGAMVFIYNQCFMWALGAIVVNRVFDGLDGEVARKTHTVSDAGGYLDICLDFLFYAGVVVAFGLIAQQNLAPALILLFTFIGTASSFLAFASVSAKHGVLSPQYPNKSLYYLGGLTEGAETILVFILFCLFPAYFPIMAYVFAGLCALTATMRIIFGTRMLQKYR